MAKYDKNGKVCMLCRLSYTLVCYDVLQQERHKMVWYCMALHGIAWYCMVLHGIAWYCMVLHGIACYCMVLHCSTKT